MDQRSVQSREGSAQRIVFELVLLGTLFCCTSLADEEITTAEKQFRMGLRQLNGEGVQGNPSEAIRSFHLAAAQGLSEAQFNLGSMSYSGRGVPQDHSKAVRRYRLAADQGQPAAQFGLGNMFFSGRGVPQVDGEAVRWHRLAAVQGLSEA